jgi:hypothetical protein
MKKLIFISTLILSLFSACAFACEPGHRIDEIVDHGKVIKLEDGSLWGVMPNDQGETASWTVQDNITTCEKTLINTTKNKTVTASPLH